MKDTTIAVLLGAGLATAAFTLPVLNPDVHAQEVKSRPASAAPAEQYKVFSLVKS